jgi:O-antigen ligase
MEKIIVCLLFVFLALFPFGQLTKIPLNFFNLPEVHLYLTDVVLFFLVLSWGVWGLLVKRKKYQLPPLAKPIFLFIALAGLSLAVNSPLFSGREVGVGFLYLLRWIFYAGLYFVLFDLKERLPWLKKGWSCFLIIIGSTVAVFGLIQYFLWPNLKALEVLQYDPHFYRLVGTFFDPGFTGIILVLTLILLVNYHGSCQVFSPKKTHKGSPFWGSPYTCHPLSFLLILFIYLALALTYSRASWLAFFVGMTVVAFYKKSFKLWLLVVGILALTWIFIPQPVGEGGKLTRTYTIQSRFTNYSQAWQIIREKPILGIGFNTLRYYQRNKGLISPEEWQVNHAGAGLDNSWLFVLATSGILGILGYLGIWGKVIQRVKRVKREKKVIILVSIGALFVHSFFLNSLFYPWVMAWVWFLLATENN